MSKQYNVFFQKKVDTIALTDAERNTVKDLIQPYSFPVPLTKEQADELISELRQFGITVAYVEWRNSGIHVFNCKNDHSHHCILEIL